VKPTQQIHQLRIFPPTSGSVPTHPPAVSHELDRIAGVAGSKRVDVSLADIAPVIADAVASGRGWLADFADDTVQIDADLYEVLLAYQQMRRFNAA
jgi:hypothetical protein